MGDGLGPAAAPYRSWRTRPRDPLRPQQLRTDCESTVFVAEMVTELGSLLHYLQIRGSDFFLSFLFFSVSNLCSQFQSIQVVSQLFFFASVSLFCSNLFLSKHIIMKFKEDGHRSLNVVRLFVLGSFFVDVCVYL